MADELRRLPDSELEVMQLLWRLEPPAPRSALEEEMQKIHPMAQTTLLTLVKRLADKGFILVEKEGRGSRYTPLVAQSDYLAAQSRRFIDRLCGGSMTAFASALCDSGLTREELDELRELLREDKL